MANPTSNLTRRLIPQFRTGGAVVRRYQSVLHAARFLATPEYSAARKQALDMYYKSTQGPDTQVVDLGNTLPDTEAFLRFQSELTSQGFGQATAVGKVFHASLDRTPLSIESVGGEFFEISSNRGAHRTLAQYFDLPFAIHSIDYDIHPKSVEPITRKMGTLTQTTGYKAAIDLTPVLKKMGFSWEPLLAFPHIIGTIPFTLDAKIDAADIAVTLKITGRNTYPDAFRRVGNPGSSVYCGIRASSAQPGQFETPYIHVEARSKESRFGFVDRDTNEKIWRAVHMVRV